MKALAILGLCLVVSCAAILPSPASPSARPRRLLGSAHTSFAKGDIGLALDLARQAEHEATGFDDQETRIEAILARAGMYRWLAYNDSARAAAEYGTSVAKDAGFACLEADGHILLWGIALTTGSEPAPAAQTLRRMCKSTLFRCRLRFMEARAALVSGDVAASGHYLRRPRNIPRAARAEVDQEHRFLLAWMNSVRGLHTKARIYGERVLAVDRLTGAKPAIVDDLLLLARIHRSSGDTAHARDCVERAIKVLKSLRPQTLVERRIRHARALLS
ncbi:hypothetical protein JXA88_00150 [Candidatus Fermentibacteria bacterium]|nr:hypothetical protein [Candidatus Fermentibacteria bacterium]